MSVVIATFNSARHLDAAVRSALAQTLGRIEIILVDDCSTDDTPQRSRQLAAEDDRIRCIGMPANGGPGAARNAGIAVARGRWLAVLDSDDVLRDDRLRLLVDAAERHDADIVADNLLVFDDRDRETARYFLPPAGEAHAITLSDYLRETVMYAGGADLGYLKPLIRLDRLRDAGLSYDETLRVGEDDDLIVRMMLRGFRYWLEPWAGYAYRKHGDSISHRLSVKAASAMRDASGRIAHTEEGAHSPGIAAQLTHRHRAIAAAAAFAEFMDALKARHAFAAAAIALRTPRMIPLIRMPIDGAMRRLGLRSTGADRPQDPAAVVALRLFSAIDADR